MLFHEEKTLLYAVEEQLGAALCSPTRELRLSGLAELCQEIAMGAVNAMGITDALTWNVGIHWILAKQSFEIARLPHFGERIRIETYPGKHLGTFMHRHYRIYDAEGHLCVQGVSLWCLVDVQTRKMIVPEEHGIPTGCHHEEGEIALPFASRLDPASLPEEGEISAPYSACDLNGHMNNAKYLDACLDLVPVEEAERCPRRVDIAYKKQIKMGERVAMRYRVDEKETHFVCDRFQLDLYY